MPTNSTGLYRDVCLALVCLGLLTTPIWFASLHLGDASYRYERYRVTTNGSDIEHSQRHVSGWRVSISDEIACSTGWEIRICSFERMVRDRGQVSSVISSGNPNNSVEPGAMAAQYQYVLLNDTVYVAAYETNTSASPDGMYQVALTLEPTTPEQALRTVSVAVESSDVPPAVARAARQGNATAHHRVAVPETPIRLDNGRYYRVYLAGSDDPSAFTRVLLPIAAFVAGILLLLKLSERVELTYVGATANSEHDED